MKKTFLFLTVFIGFGIYANAQNMQRGIYNDSKVLVYIEQRQDRYRNNPNQRADQLQLENISGQEITVHYCYKAIGLDANGDIFTEKMEYRTKTFKSGEKTSESGYMSARGYYVDSFAIMNVSVISNPSSSSTPSRPNTETQQAVAIPTWAQGTWWNINDKNQGIRITATQIVFWNGTAYDCERNDGNAIYFANCAIVKTDSPNKIELAIYIEKDNKWTRVTFNK